MPGRSSNSANPTDNYKFTGHERDDDAGLTLDYMMARNYDPVIGRFLQIDPMYMKRAGLSPFNYAQNNPVLRIDPDGMLDVHINGSEADAAFNELQSSVQGQLTLSRNSDTGEVTYTKNEGVELTAEAQQLVAAIDDNSVNVNVTAENTKFTSTGNLYIGGAFMGNQVSAGGFVTANQEVNPFVLGMASNAHGKPGADMLHEVTEAYQGALISQKSGTSAVPGGAIYQLANSLATPQSGNIYEALYDASGNQMNLTSNGNYPEGINRVEWYVRGQNGQKTVIQELKGN